jgi:hypothetical protein
VKLAAAADRVRAKDFELRRQTAQIATMTAGRTTEKAQMRDLIGRIIDDLES